MPDTHVIEGLKELKSGLRQISTAQAQALASAGSATSTSTRKRRRSLFAAILISVLSPFLVFWPISVIINYSTVSFIANSPFDRTLRDEVDAIAAQVTVSSKKAVLYIPRAAAAILRADGTDQIFYQVLGPRGEVLSGDRDFPPFTETREWKDGEVRFHDDTVRAVPGAAA